MAGTKTNEILLPKCPTGIQGFDEITEGGLPKGRPTLICGGAGSGKTLFGMEFLVRGALLYDEPGVLMAFEESAEELTQNVASFGWDLDDLARQHKLFLDHVYIERSEIEETGEYNLEGLFIRLEHAIDSIGAKRVSLDTIEALFSGFRNLGILRAELRRLLRWLKSKEVTAIITGELGTETLTRHGLEEYVSDCVILLDHRVSDQMATRRLRVVKYRGSKHGTNEYPFLIGEDGISVMPITSLGLDYAVTTERVSTGIARLDTMLGGEGFYRGSSIIVSGTAGTGKSSIAASFANAACQRGERCLYFSFEEAANQIVRNMHSIGIDLEPWVKKGLLQFHATRTTLFGLEAHLVTIHRLVEQFSPQVVVVDPISNLVAVGLHEEAKSMLARLIDFFKLRQITALFTDLSNPGGGSLELTETGISSLMDTWILLRDIESGSERNRGLYILKSRGMAHSNQIREFLLSDEGIDMLDVYTGPEGVLTGTARYSQVAKEKADKLVRDQEIERKQRDVERKRKAMEAQIAAIRAEFEAEEEELDKIITQEKTREGVFAKNREAVAHLRGKDKS
jgi:circadian clock protein KaiC